jgi:uncharacterized membrane protein SpoIIM required for sporulation
MRSIDFIQNRKETWFELEDSIKKMSFPGKANVRAARLVSFMQNYRRTSADLSLARSLFPNDQIISHLNYLVIKAMALVSGQQQNDIARISAFYTERIPQLVMRMRGLFFISLAIFTGSLLAGYFLTVLNPFAANAIIGDRYIFMTLENIQKGTPFAVYESGFKYLMSGFIMANNIKVAFMAFAFGALYGVGTFFILIFNGLMLGSITAVFAAHGLLLDFTGTVLVHGTLELFAIIAAGAAGIRFGQSIFHPGTLSRVEAVYQFGIEAFHIVFAMIPVIVIAAVLEGFVTPLQLPLWQQLGIIAASCILLFCYLILPAIFYVRRRHRAGEPVEPAIKLRF